MLFKSLSITALSVVTNFAQISSQFSAQHRHGRFYSSNYKIPGIIHRRDVSQAQIAQLQSEYTQFKGWINTFFASAPASDQGAAQLKVQFQAYDGWINGFFSQAGAGSVAASAAQPASAPPAFAATAAPASPPGSLISAPLVSSPRPTPTSAPVGTAQMATAATPSAPSAPFPANVSSTIAAAPAGSGSASPGGAFNAQASTNQAVYYGQSPQTAQVKLADLCKDPSVDIVILAFLSTFFGPAGYPVLNLGSACGSDATTKAQAKGATGILSCPEVATAIQTCQSGGKKVMLSLGGAEGTTGFSSAQQATAFAETVWQIFGGGTNSPVGRPFGNITIDGFDIDTEQKNPANYDTFVSALRTNFKQDSSKTYYISAAPQCPYPDASIPLNAMQEMDFVWVQFYNNGPCNVGESGFMASLQQWSNGLSASGAGPKLYIGAPACQTCGPNGYLQPSAVAPAIQSVHAANLKNFGGMMLWDGSEATENTAGGKDYLQVVKAALT